MSPLRRSAPCAVALALAAFGAAGQGASAGGALVPASSSVALLLAGARGADGLRAFLAAAADYAPALDPEAVGSELARAGCVDLLSGEASRAAGLAPSGVRALVSAGDAFGISVPVADAGLAQRALREWLAQEGPVRPARPAPLKGPLVAGNGARLRAGLVANVAGGRRLLAASGRGATQLVAALAHVGGRAQDTPHLGRSAEIARALAAARGPAVLWVRGSSPLLGAVLSLDASARGLFAAGLALSDRHAQVLSGAAPDLSCPRGALACARASLGPAAVPLLARAAHELTARAVPAAAREAFDQLLQRAAARASGPAVLTVDRLDAAALARGHSPLEAFPFLARASAPALTFDGALPAPSAVAAIDFGIELRGPWPLCLRAQAGAALLGAPCPAGTGEAPAPLAPGGDPDLLLSARLDTSVLAAALGKLSPLDALHSEAAAGAYAAQLLWGPLLAHSGPVSLEGRPAPGRPGSVALQLGWPLRVPLSARPRSK